MGAKLTFYGHATLGLEIDGTSIVIDPFFSGNPSASTSADAIEKLDYILLTHGHGDHVADAVGLAKRTGAKVVSNFEIGTWLQAQGVENVHQQHIGGGFHHDFGYVKMTIAHHGSQLPDGSDGGNPGGFLITTKAGKTIYIAGDTALFLDMQLYGDEGIDLAVLPIGDNFTMGPDDALKAVGFLKPGVVVPYHYNTWPPIAQDAEAWAKRVSEETEAKPRLLEPGESLEI